MVSFIFVETTTPERVFGRVIEAASTTPAFAAFGVVDSVFLLNIDI
jgi:hypothetical protein